MSHGVRPLPYSTLKSSPNRYRYPDSSQRYISPQSFALIALGLGEIDEAFHQLAMAGEQHSSVMVNFRVDPLFASLRSDPRFNQIVRRCGLSIA